MPSGRTLRRLAVPYVAVIAACSPPSPGPRVQAVLDAYAPDLPIAQPVSDAARRRYRLRVAPYLGYRDTAYIAPGGLRNVAVEVDADVDDVRPVVPPRARVASVALESPDAQTTAGLEARLTVTLGPPHVVCYAVGTAEHRREAYWAGVGGRGVLLRTTVAPPAGHGVVTFGAAAPETRYLDRTACP